MQQSKNVLWPMLDFLVKIARIIVTFQNITRNIIIGSGDKLELENFYFRFFCTLQSYRIFCKVLEDSHVNERHSNAVSRLEN